jgi:transposase, IS5 family
MLRLFGGQVESLWDEVLPVEARELPEDLAGLDRVLSDPALLVPVERAWQCSARDRGRPSIAIATFVRLMVVKQRTGWGYETLVREVSDSLHLRRFCLIAIDQRVPDESTIRKLARRLGAEVVEEITRVVIAKAQRETRFRARAARIDSTVVEADIRYPSDAMLALQGARALAREGRKLAAMIKTTAVRPGPLALDRQDGPRDLQDAGAPHRPGQDAGHQAQRARRQADRAVGHRGAAARCPSARVGTRPPRPGQAAGGHQA